MECAGFLRDLGYNVTLLSLYPYLPGILDLHRWVVFDQDLTAKVLGDLRQRGIVIAEGAKLEKLSKTDAGYDVEYSHSGPEGKKLLTAGRFRTLLLAVGRSPPTQLLGLAEAKVQTTKSGHVLGRPKEKERSVSQDHIYAVGDALHGCPQLMPVAQKSGALLGKRIAARLVSVVLWPRPSVHSGRP